jgi:hypothetical protein
VAANRSGRGWPVEEQLGLPSQQSLATYGEFRHAVLES